MVSVGDLMVSGVNEVIQILKKTNGFSSEYTYTRALETFIEIQLENVIENLKI